MLRLLILVNTLLVEINIGIAVGNVVICGCNVIACWLCLGSVVCLFVCQ